MLRNKGYSFFEKETTVDARQYVEQFRDVARVESFCRQCDGYGRRWCCPPLDESLVRRLLSYPRVTLMACVITPDDTDQPVACAMELMRPEIIRINRSLIERERLTGGLATGFAGNCSFCGDQPCTRPEGQACRHPELVRPSLEAFGFDLVSTARDLLGLEMLWSSDGSLPARLTLLTALFHNNELREMGELI